MDESTQTKIDDAKTVVEKYKLPIACATSAIVASVITWKVSGKVMNRLVQQQFAALLLRDAVLRDFVDSKGLKEEFLTEFIPSLK